MDFLGYQSVSLTRVLSVQEHVPVRMPARLSAQRLAIAQG